jgi:hypothetical protein
MNTLTMEITPAQAADFLRANIEHNRPVRNLWVRKLAAMIERGEWRMTHQGIALTPDNRLLDGQHRLLAVVLANKAVPMRVTFDCDPDAFAVLDNGVKRAISDQVRITRHAAAVYALLHLIRIRSAQSVAMPAIVDNRSETALSRPGNDSADSLDTSRMSCGRNRAGRSSTPTPRPSAGPPANITRLGYRVFLPMFATLVRDPVLHTRTRPPCARCSRATCSSTSRTARRVGPHPLRPRRLRPADDRRKTGLCARSLCRGAGGHSSLPPHPDGSRTRLAPWRPLQWSSRGPSRGVDAVVISVRRGKPPVVAPSCSGRCGRSPLHLPSSKLA